MDNSIGSQIAIYTNTSLTALETTVDAVVSVMTDRVVEVGFTVRAERLPHPHVEYVAVVKIGPASGATGDKNVRGIHSVKFFDAATNLATLEGLISAYITANPATGHSPTFSYGIPEVITYTHRNTKHFAAMLPLVSKTGGSWRKIHETDNSAHPDYDIISTDEILIINNAEAVSTIPVNLPAVASSRGREITVMFNSTAGGPVTVTAQDGEVIVLPDGTSSQTNISSVVNQSVSYECDGVKWYARVLNTVTKVNNRVTTITSAAALVTYIMTGIEEDIQCTTGIAGRTITTTLPSPALNKGRTIRFTLAVDGGANVIINAFAALGIIPMDGVHGHGVCTLSNAYQAVTFQSDGLLWNAISETGSPVYSA